MSTQHAMLSGEDLANIITSLNSVKTAPKHVEVEAKFGLYDMGRFVSDVNFTRFKSLKEVLSKNLESVETYITDHRSKSGIRKQIITEEGVERVVWQRKNTLKHFDFRDYGLRISINAEVPIAPVDDFVYDLVRNKNRESFFLQDRLRIDLTEVNTVNISNPYEKRSQESYEVELEILNWNKGDQISLFSSFSHSLRYIFEKLYNTALLYTVNEQRDLARYINNILGERSGIQLHFNMVAQARNLKYGDMIWGGLIGNEVKKDKQFVPNYYSVTHKADGLRKFLVINEVGIWLVFPPSEFNLVYRFTAYDSDLSLRGLILDGELVPNDPEHRKSMNVALKTGEDAIKGLDFFDTREREKLRLIPDVPYWYLVFDVLSVDGNKDVQFEPHSERLKRAYNAVHRLRDVQENNRLIIHFKAFKQFTSPDEFYPLMKRMFVEKDLLPYADDGFIFMPEEAPYNPLKRAERKFRRRVKLHERVLTRQPDICKWKPINRLTIDFAIQKRGDGKVNLVVGRDKIFEGTLFNPFDVETMVEHDHKLIDEYPTGSIIEFAWDFEGNKFIPVIPRPDKKKPNSISVAADVWDQLHNPITEEVLKGENFTLMRKYHNRIKKQIFKRSLQFQTNKYLLDIGSGRGGDVSKWRDYDKIVAVEPNSDHILELQKRLKTWNLENRVKIVNSGGEDTSKISKAVKEFIGDKVDTVSMMLSMTFFWKNKKMLQKLVNTIHKNLKSDGMIIFMVMDGDTVEEVFDPFFHNYKNKKIIFHQTSEDEGYATLELQPQSEVKKGDGRKAYVYIQDSIVGVTEVGKRKEHTFTPRILPKRATLNIVVLDLPIIFAGESREEKLQIQKPQVEYLVHLTDFEELLSKKRKVHNKSIYRADREYFLTDAEKRFSLLYSFGYYETSKEQNELTKLYKQSMSLSLIFENIKQDYDEDLAETIIYHVKNYLHDLISIYGDFTLGLAVKRQDLVDLIIAFTDLEIEEVEGLVKDIVRDLENYGDINEEIDVNDIEMIGDDTIKIKDLQFSVDPERLNYFLEMTQTYSRDSQLEKIAKMFLKNYNIFGDNDTSIFSKKNFMNLPRSFYTKLAKKFPKDLILEVNTTPLTTQMPFLEDNLYQENFTSYFGDVDEPFGSLGRFENFDLFGDEGDKQTTLVYFHRNGSAETPEIAKNILKAIQTVPTDRTLRVIFFLSENDQIQHKNITNSFEYSPFLVYHTYAVYVFDSEPDTNESFKELFSDLSKNYSEMLQNTLS